MLLDADTAVNQSNVERLVSVLHGGGDVPIYTGRCLQDAIDAPWNRNRRRDVARYIEAARNESAPERVPWPQNMPPSPGGGPGILFSRGLLASIRAQLPRCERFAAPGAMGDTIFAGGDSMITRCLAMLGVRCANERDLRIDGMGGRCPFAHGCTLSGLFRKNPPWLYVAAARRQRPKAHQFTEADQAQALRDTIAFHHVKPSRRVPGMEIDPRCAVRMRTDPAGRAGWWGSTCLPHFCLLGVPLAGLDALLHVVYAHPDVVRPPFASLDFFSKRGAVRRLLAEARHESNDTSAWVRLLRLYADHFPAIDPRDFHVTGEASPEYFYTEVASSFFVQPYLRLMRHIILLREPTARTLMALAEIERGQPNASRQMSRSSEKMLASARRIMKRCGAATLYRAACASCGEAHSSHTLPTPLSSSVAEGGSCGRRASELLATGGDEAWGALWRSWYHLFLPSWLAFRHTPLVLFTDDLEHSQVATTLRSVAQFLQLRPLPADAAQLAFRGSLADTLAGTVSKEVEEALHELTVDSLSRTDALLRAAGQRSIPRRWVRV